MCESAAFVRRGEDEELVLEEVVFIEPVDGGYVLRTLFGEEATVAGRIAEVNLLKHKVVFTSE